MSTNDPDPISTAMRRIQFLVRIPILAGMFFVTVVVALMVVIVGLRALLAVARHFLF